MMQSRTHTCGQLRIENAGERVTLVGWMENVRVVGNNFAFLVLRDFYGTTQIVVETEEIMNIVKGINKESTISVTGTVRERAAEAVNPGHTKIGRVASGDQFIADKEKKDFIIEKTQALCTEMEGAAIAQTAYRNGVPFVILRAISDKADNSAEMDYPTFETLSAHRCAEVTHRLARTLLEAESA